jgi:hypothetical protein
LIAEGALAALLVAASVEVESATDCPSAAAVAARLPPGPGPADRALVRASEGRLTLALVRADGGVVVERQLEVRGSCDDLAGAVALIITLWQAQEHPALPGPPALPTTPPRTGPWSLEARTDLFASLAGAAVDPGAAFTASLWRRRWGLGFSLSGTTPRTEALGRGRTSWLRGTVGIGPAARLLPARVHVDLRLEGLLGLTFARGSGYQTDAAPVGSLLGGRLGLEASRAWGRLLLSAGAAGTYWPAQALVVDAGGVQRALPRAEARAGAGVGFRFDL